MQLLVASQLASTPLLSHEDAAVSLSHAGVFSSVQDMSIVSTSMRVVHATAGKSGGRVVESVDSRNPRKKYLDKLRSWTRSCFKGFMSEANCYLSRGLWHYEQPVHAA